MLPTLHQLYLANLHDNFVRYIDSTLTLINTLLLMPQATEEDKKVLDIFKGILHNHDVEEVKRRLRENPIRRSTLDMMEKIYKDHVDFAIDHLHESPLCKQFWKQLSHAQIEQNKNVELQRLHYLGIQINNS